MNDPEMQVEASASRPDPANSSYAVLRNRDLVLYLTGRFVAVVGQQMFAMAGEPKEFVWIEGAEHFFEGKLDQVRDAISGWVQSKVLSVHHERG